MQLPLFRGAVPPTTAPLSEHELTELALLWGRVSRAELEVLFVEESDAAGFEQLMSAMGRLIDEVGRLRGVVAALSADGAREAPPAQHEGT